MKKYFTRTQPKEDEDEEIKRRLTLDLSMEEKRIFRTLMLPQIAAAACLAPTMCDGIIQEAAEYLTRRALNKLDKPYEHEEFGKTLEDKSAAMANYMEELVDTGFTAKVEEEYESFRVSEALNNPIIEYADDAEQEDAFRKKLYSGHLTPKWLTQRHKNIVLAQEKIDAKRRELREAQQQALLTSLGNVLTGDGVSRGNSDDGAVATEEPPQNRKVRLMKIGTDGEFHEAGTFDIPKTTEEPKAPEGQQSNPSTEQKNGSEEEEGQ